MQVTDTGIGIPPAQLPVIFDRFRQAHSGKGGTGLGLAIVKSLMEAHEGHITVESQEGKGSRFTVSFPRATAHAAVEKAQVEHA
jgi:signal transduction histidine kinase